MKLSSNYVPHFENCSDWKIAIVMSRYNDVLGNELLENVVNTLKQHHLQEKNLEVIYTPGALEIPFATKKILDSAQKFDAIITLGMVIKGDTYHFELVCDQSYKGLMDLNLNYKTPIIFGILTVNNLEQAQARVSNKGLNKGKEFAEAALEMINLNQK